MSPDLPPGAVRAFYGTPQHETRSSTDAERARVASVSSPPTDRELRSYAERSASTPTEGRTGTNSDSDSRRSNPEERRAHADTLRRRAERERTDEESPASRLGARGIMVRW
ncbi:hypothetical protein [Halogeometricum luteum]|uniref:Uncharacterized protein n=1 Tax=Halogeometricum luteum TaxID=2950537 RepID=A0ABU2G5M7_9EURY|nr:hypothetical protein [Halogeometricum sp. S3BR5-2]MDS0296097.1 hypothetical protein [Halogeometricum sp. S3BR5-2]